MITLFFVNAGLAAAGMPALGAAVVGGGSLFDDWFNSLTHMFTTSVPDNSVAPPVQPGSTEWKTNIFWNSKYGTVTQGGSVSEYELCRQIGETMLCVRATTSGESLTDMSAYLTSSECGGVCSWFPSIPSGGPSWPRYEFWRVMIEELKGELQVYVAYETIPQEQKADWATWEEARVDPRFVGSVAWLETLYGVSVTFTDGPGGVGGSVLLSATTPTKSAAVSSCDGLYLPYAFEFGCVKTTRSYSTTIYTVEMLPVLTSMGYGIGYHNPTPTKVVLFSEPTDPVGVGAETVIVPAEVANGKSVVRMSDGAGADNWHYIVVSSEELFPEAIDYSAMISEDYEGQDWDHVVNYVKGLSLIDKMIFASWYAANADPLQCDPATGCTTPSYTVEEFDKYAKGGDESILTHTFVGNLITPTIGDYRKNQDTLDFFTSLGVCHLTELKKVADKRRAGALPPMINDPTSCFEEERALWTERQICAVQISCRGQVHTKTVGHVPVYGFENVVAATGEYVSGKQAHWIGNVWSGIWGMSQGTGAGSAASIRPVAQSLYNALMHCGTDYSIPTEASLCTHNIVTYFVENRCNDAGACFIGGTMITKEQFDKAEAQWMKDNCPSGTCTAEQELHNLYKVWPKDLVAKFTLTKLQLEKALADSYFNDLMNGWTVEELAAYAESGAFGSGQIDMAQQMANAGQLRLTADWMAHIVMIKMGELPIDNEADLKKKCEANFLTGGVDLSGGATKSCGAWAKAVIYDEVNRAYPKSEADANQKQYDEYMASQWVWNNRAYCSAGSDKCKPDSANPYDTGACAAGSGKCGDNEAGVDGWYPGKASTYESYVKDDPNTPFNERESRCRAAGYRYSTEKDTCVLSLVLSLTGNGWAYKTARYSEEYLDIGATRYYSLCLDDLCMVYKVSSGVQYPLALVGDYFTYDATYHVSSSVSSILMPVLGSAKQFYLADLWVAWGAVGSLLLASALFLFLRRRPEYGARWR